MLSHCWLASPSTFSEFPLTWTQNPWSHISLLLEDLSVKKRNMIWVWCVYLKLKFVTCRTPKWNGITWTPKAVLCGVSCHSAPVAPVWVSSKWATVEQMFYVGLANLRSSSGLFWHSMMRKRTFEVLWDFPICWKREHSLSNLRCHQFSFSKCYNNVKSWQLFLQKLFVISFLSVLSTFSSLLRRGINGEFPLMCSFSLTSCFPIIWFG